MLPPKTSTTLFIDKDSWVRRLHPFTKLSYILFTGVIVYAGLLGWEAISVLLFVNTIAVTSGRIVKEVYLALGKIMLPLILFMVPIHGFLYPDNTSILSNAYGLTLYQEGLFFAFATILKLTVVLMTSLLFVFSTHPADLITAVSHSSKSPSLAYLLGSPLLLLAGMSERTKTIQEAQRARGLHARGNIFRRFNSLAPLILPLVVGAIIEIEQRSIALEIRGFKSTSSKTFLRTVPDSIVQRFVRRIMLAVASIIIISRCSGEIWYSFKLIS